MFRIGIDLGGTKIEAIALDGSREMSRLRTDTPRDDYRATVEAVVALVTALENRIGARATVGVGIPGALTPNTGLVKNANSVWLIGRPLRDDLQARLGREVLVANDANCFAMSEAADGAAAGAPVVFGVIIGTGVGAGIVIRGGVLTGPNAIAGEWGHNPLPWPDAGEWPGPACYCGKTGCIELFLSGPGLAREYEERCGRRETAQRVAEAAGAGESHACAALRRYEERMARALAGVINVLDPDVIVLGGGLSNIERLYTNVPRRWAEYVFAATGPTLRLRQGYGEARRSASGAEAAQLPTPDASGWTRGAATPGLGVGSGKSGVQRRPHVRTRLVRAAHGDASGVRGAAWLWAPAGTPPVDAAR